MYRCANLLFIKACLCEVQRLRRLEVRTSVVESLGQLEDSEAVPRLVDMLGDTEPGIRARAAVALGEIGDSSAVPRLIEALDDCEDWPRDAAASALVDLDMTGHMDAAVTAFIGVLEDRGRRNYYNRGIVGSVVVALGRLRDPRAVPVLAKALTSYHKYVPSEAATALGQIGDPKAVPHLVEALKYGSSRDCGAAAAALGEIGDLSAVPPLLDAFT